MRKRQVKKFGGSYGIHLTLEDLNDLDLKENDKVDIEDIVKTK